MAVLMNLWRLGADWGWETTGFPGLEIPCIGGKRFTSRNLLVFKVYRSEKNLTLVRERENHLKYPENGLHNKDLPSLI